MNFCRTSGLIGLTLGLLFTQTGIAQKAAANSTNDPAVLALQKDIPTLMKEAEIPGLSIALIRDGKTAWLQSFGVKDEKTKAPVTDETVFSSGSLSKPVFAYGVLKLVDQGKLDLDTPLSSYLPKLYIEGDDRLAKITARIVLSHRTGFPNWRGNDPLKIYFTPGERFSYSGEGMAYLQRVVEQITGKPLNDYMQEAVFGPLGMKNSSYVWRKDFDDSAAVGHDTKGQPVDLFKPGEANAAASLNTTAQDYAAFVNAVIAGTGLNPATLREMEKAQIAVDPECTNCTDRVPKELSKTIFWGLGWGIQETAQGEALWHWGDNGVFKAFVMFRPENKSGVVYFANSENGLSIARKILADALGGDQPVFDWIKYENYDSPGMKFVRVVRNEGAAAALKQFSTELKNGEISENVVNQEGYSLMGAKKMNDAILIFQKNVDMHPASFNAYDSLGEAYMNNGQKDLAIQNYKKSVELNPNNTNGVAMLKKLRGE